VNDKHPHADRLTLLADVINARKPIDSLNDWDLWKDVAGKTAGEANEGIDA
jgi:hypothetical protein